MSYDVKSFLNEIGVATSRKTPYNPQGNGQVERLNGTLWKTITLALKSQQLNINRWEDVLSQALNSLHTLLCTKTNATLHERMFSHHRRSTKGSSLPSWLFTPGTVFRAILRHLSMTQWLMKWSFWKQILAMHTFVTRMEESPLFP